MDVPATPRFVVTELGLALIVKSGAAPTLYVTIALCDNEPLVPVTVIVKEPDAVGDAEHESVLVPEFPSVTIVGESVHVVVPEVPPVTAEVNETGPVKPFRPVAVIVDVPAAPPAMILTLVGLAAIVKSWTVNVTMAVCDKFPLVPVTVTVYVPADPEQESEDVAEPPEGVVTLVGFKLHVKPVDGDTDAVNDTAPLNPFKLDTVIVEVPAVPALTLTEVGLVLIIKSGAAPTLYVTVAECESEPLAPVT